MMIDQGNGQDQCVKNDAKIQKNTLSATLTLSQLSDIFQFFTKWCHFPLALIFLNPILTHHFIQKTMLDYQLLI